MKAQTKFVYNVVFKEEPKGGFTVIVPSLPGCVTYGKNLRVAKAMAADAINGYLQSIQKHGDSIPSDVNSFFATIDLNIVPVYA